MISVARQAVKPAILVIYYIGYAHLLLGQVWSGIVSMSLCHAPIWESDRHRETFGDTFLQVLHYIWTCMTPHEFYLNFVKLDKNNFIINASQQNNKENRNSEFQENLYLYIIQYILQSFFFFFFTFIMIVQKCINYCQINSSFHFAIIL